MKNKEEYEKDLAEIRSLMERSVKFISLSGLSGVAAGCYALAGTIVAYFILYGAGPPMGKAGVPDGTTLTQLVLCAMAVLALSLGTGYWLSLRKAKRQHTGVWNPASRKMLVAIGIPLLTGGIFIVILIGQGNFGLIAPGCLLFYGLALLNGSFYTFGEIRYLGMLEIAIGLWAAAFPGFGLIAWGTGFGVLHIVYGLVMYNRYDR